MGRGLVAVVSLFVASCSESPSIEGGVDAGGMTPDSGEACWAVTAAECESRGCRVIPGRHLTDAGAVYDPVGCKPADELCGTAITYGHPPDAGAECWQFTDTCLPLGWPREEGDPRSNPLCPTY